jgi:thiol-disulfide isomerase/thioredoxin
VKRRDRWALIAAGLLAGASGCGPAKPRGPAPDFAVKALLQADRPALASLKDLGGQAVVLEFWATWCGPCRETLPSMNKMIDSFAGRPVRFISVTDEPRETVEAFLKTHPMKAWIGLDDDDKIHAAFQVKSIPQLFVIDRYGRIWHKLDPMFFYKSDIEDAINAPAPAS